MLQHAAVQLVDTTQVPPRHQQSLQCTVLQQPPHRWLHSSPAAASAAWLVSCVLCGGAGAAAVWAGQQQRIQQG